MAFHPNVLLGIPDEVIVPADDLRNEWTTNKFGGTPNWMQGPPAEYPHCSLCNTFLPLVTQIYCPLENSLFHRVLYIFGCANNSCWNNKQSWKVLRCQKLEVGHKTIVSQIEKTDNWFDEDDAWGEEDNEPELQTMSALKEIEQQTRNLNLNKTGSLNSHRTLTHEQLLVKEQVEQFVPYYISVIEESQLMSETKTLSRYEKKLLVEYQKREGLQDIDEILEPGTCSKGWGGEKYEQNVAKHGDKILHKFIKQVNLCTKQCLRYSLNGKPLIMTSENLGEIPHCSSCGKERVFEIQLMPALVLLLQKEQKSHNEKFISEDTTHSGNSVETPADLIVQSHSERSKGETTTAGSQNIDFGTVYIYTCMNSCWSDDTMFQEEYLIVHSEPDQHAHQLK